MSTNKDSEAIEALDLTLIKMKLMHIESGEGWTKTRAETVEQQYRRFLYLMKKYPNEQISPTVDVDTFWHYHILDTMKYAEDCEQAFGYFLHHYPYVGIGDDASPEDQVRSGERMRELYASEFGEAESDSQRAAAWCAVTTRMVFTYTEPAADKTAWCAAAVRYGGTAWCAAAAPMAATAWCAVTDKSTKAAWCAVTGKSAKTAWCAVTGKSAKTAWCAVTGKSAKTAWCAVTGKSAKTAWCAVTGKSTKTAWCAVTGKSAKTAWCAVTGKSAKTAWCAAAANDPTSAWCAVTAKSAMPARHGASVRAAQLAPVLAANSAWCAVTSAETKRAWCAVTGRADTGNSGRTMTTPPQLLAA
jgi:hypothetical protein